MKGAVTTVLMPINVKLLRASSRYDLADRFAGAFARFPYLESFFVWRRTGWPVTTYFFNRADEPPAWDRSDADDDVYPVLIRADPPAAAPVIEQARAEAVRGARFAVFEITVEGEPYQAFVHLLFGGGDFEELIALAAWHDLVPVCRGQPPLTAGRWCMRSTPVRWSRPSGGLEVKGRCYGRPESRSWNSAPPFATRRSPARSRPVRPRRAAALEARP